LATPRLGCLAVLWRGDPTGPEGHVGFFLGADASGVHLLGGNQGDRVSVEVFPRGRVLGYRWPAFEASAGAEPAARAPAEDQFERALAHVLALEGGWSDDPYDPGGPTNMGVTLAVLARWQGIAVSEGNVEALKRQLKSLPAETARAIYRERYWRAAACPKLPWPLALMHFDAAVNQGVKRATLMLQEALGVEIDGEIGPETLAAAHAAVKDEVLARHADIRRRAYRALPHFWRFGRGWLARVEATLRAAHAPADAVAPPVPQPAPPVPAPTPILVPPKETSPMAIDIVKPAQPASSAPLPLPPPAPQPEALPKWWGQSMTIWGVLVTAVTAVIPAVAQAFGIDLPAQLLRDLAAEIGKLVQATGGVIGIALTIWGRIRAQGPLGRREMVVRL
jgi:lysozyme family protein